MTNIIDRQKKAKKKPKNGLTGKYLPKVLFTALILEKKTPTPMASGLK